MSDPTALPVRLNEGQRQYLLGLVRANIRKVERRIASRDVPFVPEPGKRDTNLWKLEKMRELAALLDIPPRPDE